jgi:hypothetical protein
MGGAKSGRPGGGGPERCLEKSLKRGSFPVVGFSCGAELALVQAKRQLPKKACASEDQDFGICDMLSPIQEPKWKSWLESSVRRVCPPE